MKDRLTNLQEVLSDPECVSTVELENGSEQEAPGASSQLDQKLEGVLQEAMGIRQEIQQIQTDICELKLLNHQALHGTSHPTAPKWDAGAIGADIKRRGEAVLRRLQAMNALCKTAEAQQGSGDTIARIAQIQYQCLSKALQEVMFNYNNTEMNHREACRRHIQRQLEVVGREVSEEQLEEMEGGQWNVFSVHAEGKTAGSALKQIESRRQELLELEKRIQSMQELFLDVSVLTEEQGAATEAIYINVQKTEATIQDARGGLNNAITRDNNNPLKRMFCCCFPCFKNEGW